MRDFLDWLKNLLTWRQCDSEIPIGKRSIACCVRAKGHWGAHQSNGGIIW